MRQRIDLVKIEVTEEVRRVENIELEIAEENLPVVVWRSRHDSKPLRKLIKLQQYLTHEERISRTFVTIIGSIYIPR